MAIPNTNGGASAPPTASNVVRLPTAAPRQVRQRYNKHLRAFRAANPWPGEYIFPSERERRAQKDAELAWAARIERSPGMFVVLAMLEAFPRDRRGMLSTLSELMLLRNPDDESAQLGARIIAQVCKRHDTMSEEA